VSHQDAEAAGEAVQVDLALGEPGQLLQQRLPLVPQPPPELCRGRPPPPVHPLPPGGEHEAELGGGRQVEELPAERGQPQRAVARLGELAGVAQQAQQGRPPPGQRQPLGPVAQRGAAGEPLRHQPQAGRVQVAPAGQGQAIVGQAQQELPHIVGEAAEGPGEQHGWTTSLPRSPASMNASARPGPSLSAPVLRSASRSDPDPTRRLTRMEVKLGVTYSPKELVVEVEQSADDVAGMVEAAMTSKAKVLWLTDAKGRRVGVPTDKLAYVEVGEEHPDKRVGFSSM
jgi:hypothetical protein